MHLQTEGAQINPNLCKPAFCLFRNDVHDWQDGSAGNALAGDLALSQEPMSRSEESRQAPHLQAQALPTEHLTACFQPCLSNLAQLGEKPHSRAIWVE